MTEMSIIKESEDNQKLKVVLFLEYYEINMFEVGRVSRIIKVTPIYRELEEWFISLPC